MKLNLSQPFLDIDGNPSKTEAFSLGQLLSTFLAGSNSKTDAIKFYEWAKKMHKNEELDLDSQDQKLLIKFISEHDMMVTALRAQLLEAIESCKA